VLEDTSPLGITITIVLVAIPLTREFIQWRRERALAVSAAKDPTTHLAVIRVPDAEEHIRPSGISVTGAVLLVGYGLTTLWLLIQWFRASFALLDELRRSGERPPGPDEMFTVAQDLTARALLSVLGNPLNFLFPFLVGAALAIAIKRRTNKRLPSDAVRGRVLVAGDADVVWLSCTRLIRYLDARIAELDRSAGRIELVRDPNKTRIHINVGQHTGEAYPIDITAESSKPNTDSRGRNAVMVHRGLETLTGLTLEKDAGVVVVKEEEGSPGAAESEAREEPIRH
jgi:hypothetical protein